MELTASARTHSFLQGGGEMGELTRQYDWTTTSLGTPDQWPQSLRTTLSILLSSKFPMFLWWGEDRIQFYNDAYRPSLGNDGKHPAALGQRGADYYPETWPTTRLLIDGVLTSGEATWREDERLPVYRNGRSEDVYWTTSYSPVRDESGEPAGVLVTCSETTQKVQTLNQLRFSEQRFQNLVQEASVGIILLSGEAMRVELVNNAYAQLIDRRPEDLLGKSLFAVIPETEATFRPLIDQVRSTGERVYRYEQPYTINGYNGEREGFLNLVYQPYKEPDGSISGVMVLCQDVTQPVVATNKLAASKYQFQSLIEEAPVATCLFVGRELVIEIANSRMMDIWGKGNAVLGKPVAEVLPELQGQPFLKILDDIYTTGQTYQATADKCDLVVDGQLKTFYFNFTYKPLRTVDGQIYAIMNMAVDVTEQVLAQQQIEQSQLQLLTLFEQSQVGIAILDEPDLVFRMANPFYGALVGRPIDQLLGKPLLEALPELAGQGFDDLLKGVIKSGIPYIASETPANVIRHDQLETIYVDMAYQPQRDANNRISGVFVVATDVTQQVKARKGIEASQADLQQINQRLALALEAGELGSYDLDLATGQMTSTPKYKANFGLSPEADFNFKDLLAVVADEDRASVEQAVADAVATRSTYHAEYRVNWPNGTRHWIKASGQPVYAENGQPSRMIGVTQETTAQREQQLALEQQVQQRTDELATANAELEASNEEMLLTNNELAEANGLLIRSNDNLQKFAYVASHDLQEPLRKIQQFGDLLRGRYAAELGEGADYLQRMQVAANRMSTLIRDLLTFSRISTQRDTSEAVSLTQIVKNTVVDLDLLIQETRAVVIIQPLPIVQGDPSQLGQLFQNLLSNALKFSRPNSPPLVKVSTQTVSASQLPASILPGRHAKMFHRIDVSDNGIGFDEKYLDRIFQVFQRLHSKSEFVGTGIGLAICEKVVTNHGGAITASSEPGQGATFSVYLPA